MLFKPKFKIGDKVKLTTTYYWDNGSIRVKAGTVFTITERLTNQSPSTPSGRGYTLREYTCYSCSTIPWLPQHHLKLVKQPIHLTKSTTATKPSLLTRLVYWLLY